MVKPLIQKLEKFRRAIELNQKTRLQDRTARVKDMEQKAQQHAGLRGFTPSGDMLVLMDGIRHAAQRAVTRYAATSPAADAAAIIPLETLPASTFTQALRLKLDPVLSEADGGVEYAHLTGGGGALMAMLDTEMQLLTDEAAMQGNLSAVLIPKLKLVRQALQAQRYGDAMTILKTSLRSNPHNHLLLFLLSQILYFLTSQGQQGALPEARDYAQRSTIFSEKVNPLRLAHYRWQAIASECLHEPERALAWIRETDLLNPDRIVSGWEGDGGTSLKCWALLAQIPVKYWNEPEFHHLQKLVNTVPGGGLIYVMWLRPQLLEEAATRKLPLAGLEELEQHLQISWMLFQQVHLALSELAGKLHQPYWVVRARYLATLLQVAPLPGFDHVLLHIALGGRDWRKTFPDAELQAAVGEPGTSYWRLWAGSISHVRESRQLHLLPAQELLEDVELIGQANGVLEELRQAEQSRIKHDVWSTLLPWMVRWQLDHLLAAGTGSNQPRLRFAPSLPPYSGYYHRWSDPSPQHVLASDIIAENAGRGAFASLFELLAAFDGAVRLLDDPVHGLGACQKRALQAAKQQDPAKFGGVRMDSMAGGKTGLLLLPLLLVGAIFVILQVSANMGQALGLILALAGLCGIVAVRLLLR